MTDFECIFAYGEKRGRNPVGMERNGLSRAHRESGSGPSPGLRFEPASHTSPSLPPKTAAVSPHPLGAVPSQLGQQARSPSVRGRSPSQGVGRRTIRLIASIDSIAPMVAKGPPTTIPVQRQTLERLRAYKVGGASYDDLINDLLATHPPEEFFLEHVRRLRGEKRRPWREIKDDLGL